MTINEYPTLATRTLATNDYIDQGVHLVLGISGEYLSEVVPLLTSSLKNKGALEEELGDVMWYVGCYCVIYQLEFRPLATKPLDSLEKAIGELLEMHKKNYAYGKELIEKEQIKYIQTIIYWVYHIADTFDIEVDQMLEKNIEKLKIRYPDSFKSEQAINKDSEKESKVFEVPKLFKEDEEQ